MSHSITTTASYVLSKYSRSYPSVGAQAVAPAEPEWQHFTNPVMRVILEAKKSPSGQLVSMRLRILWNLHTELNDLHVDQREVVFEDLELLSFSSLPVFQTSVPQLDQSLPLKAVYRDALVGVRYLHPRIVAPGSQPVYRRFQVTFNNAHDASQCIDAIKSVCPCKASPHPTHFNRQSTTLSASLMQATKTATGPAPSRSTRLAEQVVPIQVDSLVPSTMRNHVPDNQPILIAPTLVATSLSSDDSAFVTCSETSYKTNAQVDHRKDGLPQTRGRDTAPSSLPNSSPPSSSSDQSGIMPPPPVPQNLLNESTDATARVASSTVDVGNERSEILASLSKHPSLYELSRSDLETLVSQVIREDGFLRLLESLDSLWRVKGYLGR